MLRFTVVSAILFAIVPLSLVRAQAKSTAAPPAMNLTQFRDANPTHLTRHGPPPEMWQDPRPLKLPAGVKEVTYTSGDLKLKAWLSDVPTDGKLHPAVVFCHGGFWFGNEDWDVLKPFLDAGFIVMAPRLRAENGNPGDFEFYYHEVDDVIAAGKFLAEQKGVDKSRLFVSGHSAGGDLSTLAVEAPNPFVMSAPIGASLTVLPMALSKNPRYAQLIVFDRNNIHEIEARSAIMFTSGLKAPIVLFSGDKEEREKIYGRFVELAHSFNKDASMVVVPGDHGEALPNAIPEIIKRFQAYKPAKN